MSSQKYLSFTIAVLFTLCLSGCGKNVPFSGKVVYSDDKTPVTCGMIYFESSQALSRSKINEDGTFLMKSQEQNDGIPKGTYKVYITDAAVPSSEKSKGQNLPPDMTMYVPLIAEKYSSAQTSGLSITINQSQKEYVIEVDRFLPEQKK